MDHSRAAFTIWLLAGMIQMSSARLNRVAGSCHDRILLEAAHQPDGRDQQGRQHRLKAEHGGGRLQESLGPPHEIQQQRVPDEHKHHIDTQVRDPRALEVAAAPCSRQN